LETFADTPGASPLFCLTEVLFTSLLIVPEAVLLEPLVAEGLSTSERLLSIDLPWVD